MNARQGATEAVLEHAGEIAMEFVATKLALVQIIEGIGRTTPASDLGPMTHWAYVVLGNEMFDPEAIDEDLLNRASEIEGVMWRAIARFCELRAEMTVGSGYAPSHA